MKKIISLFAAVFILSANLYSQSSGHDAFEKFKSLEGKWKAAIEGGEVVEVIYEVVSNKSVVMETIKSGEEAGMITMYHLDEDKLMVTHYCSAGNQPRMIAESIDPGLSAISFNFLDVTDAGSDEGYMTNIDFTFKDSEHFTQTWTWKKENESAKTVFEYEKVK